VSLWDAFEFMQSHSLTPEELDEPFPLSEFAVPCRCSRPLIVRESWTAPSRSGRIVQAHARPRKTGSPPPRPPRKERGEVTCLKCGRQPAAPEPSKPDRLAVRRARKRKKKRRARESWIERKAA
jgi:hypothetical protein